MTRMGKVCEGEERTALYRFYDASEKLLYVGITNDPWRRWRQHVQEKPWYPQVKHQAVTWYDGRIAAEKAERVAIRCEHPQFNIAGAVRPVTQETAAKPVPQPPPVAEPQQAAEPSESPAPDRRSRTLLALLICAAWSFLPSMPGMPSWDTPWGIAIASSTVIPVTMYLLICVASSIHRFGRWLDQTFTPNGSMP